MKKIMLLALAAISAMLVLPVGASATPAHVQTHAGGNPGEFTIHGGASALSRTAGGGTHASTTTGTGSFENTTTGTIKLTFHKVTTALGPCASTAEGHAQIAGGGTVTTTTLPFHMIMIETNVPGILITPAAGGHFASYTCPFLNVHVKGTGIIGTVTSPACGKESNTATVKFDGTEGHQKHITWTGNTYDLESRITSTGAYSTSAMTAEATIAFNAGVTPTLICTH